MSPEKNNQKRTMTETDRRALSLWLGKVVLYGTFGLLMFGPLAFGAVEPWSIFVLEAGATALTLTWLIQQSLNGEINIRWNPLFAPMLAFAGLAVLQVVLGSTAYRHDTVSEILLYCAYGMLCFLATQVLSRTVHAQKIAVLLTVYGIALASFALLQGIAPNGKLYWLRLPSRGGWIYGPYVNHNHYAGLMELLAPIPLILALTRVADDRERIAAGIGSAIMVGTIFLSGSRGGMLAIFTEIAVLAVMFLRERKRSIRITVAAGAFLVVLVGILTWLGGKELTARVSTIPTESKAEISGGMRFSIDRDAIRMARAKPLLGWGLGAFPVVNPQFRSFYTNFFINEAHNDYLQLLAEMGTVGFAILVWFLLTLFRHALPKIGSWMTDISGATTLACTLGFIGILVHSLFDFNLQIPANAAIFYVLCSIAAAPPLQQRNRRRKPIVPTDEQELMPASEVV